MGKIIIQSLIKASVDIVAVFDHNTKVGSDVGKVCFEEEMGILISDINTLENSLKQNKPDICIVATKSLLKHVYDIFYTCTCCSTNVISICEEAFYPQNSYPTLT